MAERRTREQARMMGRVTLGDSGPAAAPDPGPEPGPVPPGAAQPAPDQSADRLEHSMLELDAQPAAPAMEGNFQLLGCTG